MPRAERNSFSGASPLCYEGLFELEAALKQNSLCTISGSPLTLHLTMEYNIGWVVASVYSCNCSCTSETLDFLLKLKWIEVEEQVALLYKGNFVCMIRCT